jgi:hypothetical protein
MDQVALAFGEITGLNAYAWPKAKISPPAVVLTYPESVDYDQTYGRGEDMITDLPVQVIIGRPTDRDTREKAAQYADGDGPASVKTYVEGYAYTACDDVQVVRAEFEVVSIGEIPYLAVTFSCNVTGSGRD